MSKSQHAHLFPNEDCRRIISELSVWTSVEDCLAAARFLEERSIPEDSLSFRLIVPFPDADEYQQVLVQCMEWFIKSFAVPSTKVRLAAIIDPKISVATRKTLIEARFAPNISIGPAEAISAMSPALARRQEDRFLVIEDEPHIIELIQNPIRCLNESLSWAWPGAYRMRQLREQAMETGGAPTIFHQPYTDGPFPSLVEALLYYVNGLEVGPRSSTHQQGVNIGYRSFQVIGRPPVDAQMFKVAQDMTRKMFESIE
jgi:hypothetical protein